MTSDLWKLSAVRPTGAKPQASELAAFARAARGLDASPGFMLGELWTGRETLEAALDLSLETVKWSPEAVEAALLRLSDDLTPDLAEPYAFFVATVEAGLCLAGGGPPQTRH